MRSAPEGSGDRVAALRGFRAPTPAVDVPCVPLRRVAGSFQSNGYRQRAGSLSRDQPQADFGRDTAQLHVWRLVQHVRMHRCGRRLGLCGGCARSCSTLSAPCTTWLVAFALKLPASLFPPSSRSLPAARSFACRRQAPSAAWQHQPRYDCVLCRLCLLLPGLVAPAHRPAAERVRVLLRRRPLRESELDSALHLS